MNPNQLRKLARRWTLPVAALAAIAAIAAYLVSKSITPVYEAKGAVLVVAGPNQAAAASSLNINATEATTTAATLLTEPPLLQHVSDALKLGEAPDMLAKSVTATAQSNTELVDVTARDASPARAAQIANALMSAYVAQVTNENGQRLQQAGAAHQAQIVQVQDTINQEQQSLAAAVAARTDTTALRATISSNTALLSELTLNYSSFRSTQAQNLEAVSVAAAASEPTVPASPRVPLNTTLGAAGGLLVGVAGAALFEYLDQGLHNAEDVVDRLGMPCLGIVPRYKTSRVISPAKSAVKEKRAAEAASEAYRRLRTNILFSTPDSELSSVVITSVRSGEGKTCTAANLAVALASSEKRVLLIDADMRRPDQHRLFGKGLSNGMSELILKTNPGDVPSLNGLHATQFGNLSLLTSGTIPPNPSELLASMRAQLLLASLTHQHDLLVIDTPPAGMVTDALSLASKASVTVLVVEAGKTNAAQAASVIDALKSVGANVIGVVLNKSRIRDLAGYYEYGGYGYTYTGARSGAPAQSDALAKPIAEPSQR